jgi:alpha-tubulin suppressor-like RCC1 family protein
MKFEFRRYQDKIISIYDGFGIFSAALTSNGEVFMWGINTNGELGNKTFCTKVPVYVSQTPENITRNFPLVVPDKIIQLSLGGSHSSALSFDGRLFTWGYNNFGQLGLGFYNYTTTNTPSDITSNFSISKRDQIHSVSLGFSHSAALTRSGRLFLWGSNYYGEIGDGTFAERTNPVDITKTFDLKIDDKITSVSLGYHISFCVTLRGRIFVWGNQNFYNFSQEIKTTKPFEITAMFSLNQPDRIISIVQSSLNYCALSSFGRVFMVGHNNTFQLGDGTNSFLNTPKEITDYFSLSKSDRISSVWLNGYYSSALSSNNEVFFWGDNREGQFGIKRFGFVEKPTNISSKFNIDKIIQLSLRKDTLAGHQNAALTSEGKVYIWGDLNGENFDQEIDFK